MLPRGTPPTAAPASPTPGLIYSGDIDAGMFQLLLFSTSASGNVPPIRTFDGYLPFGADKDGVWSVNLGGSVLAPSPAPTSNSSVTHYSPHGRVLANIEMQPGYGAAAGATDAAGTIYVADGYVGIFDPENDVYECYFPDGFAQVDEFAAGSNGLAHPFATLELAASSCNASSLTIDGDGRLWIAAGFMGENFPALGWHVLEYPAHAKGFASPLRSIALTTTTTGPSIAVDAAGNLYVGESGALVRYAPTSDRPQTILSGQGQYFVTIDAHDDVFVQIASLDGFSAVIEELKPGGGAPSRFISGSKTELAGAAGLAVTR